MPPTHTDEGLRAAKSIRQRYPQVGILVLSQHVHAGYAIELLTAGTQGVGYLLKERVSDLAELAASVRRVGAGGSVLDPVVVSQLVDRRRVDDPLAGLTAREREVLAAMAEGRSNKAIAERLCVTEHTIEKHVKNIFETLRLASSPDDHRRVHGRGDFPQRPVSASRPDYRIALPEDSGCPSVVRAGPNGTLDTMADHFSPGAVGRWSIRHPWLAIAVWLAFVFVSVGLSGRDRVPAADRRRRRPVRSRRRAGERPSGRPRPDHRDLPAQRHGAGQRRVVQGRDRAGVGGHATRLRRAGDERRSAPTSTRRCWSGRSTRGVSPTAITWAVAGFNADHQRISAQWVNDSVTSNDLQRAERLSVPVTLLVLLIAFGALVAAIVPVLLAVTAVVAAFGLLGPISHLFPLDPASRRSCC